MRLGERQWLALHATLQAPEVMGLALRHGHDISQKCGLFVVRRHLIVTRGRLLQRSGGVLFVLALVAVAAARITPVSWFPWDWVIALGLFVAGIGLHAAGKRARSHNASGESSTTRAKDAV